MPHPHDPARQAVAAVDVGGTKTAAAIVLPDLTVVAERTVPTPRDGDDLIRAVAGLVADLAARSGHPPRRLGLAVAALIDTSGRVVTSTHLDLADRDVRADLAALAGVPVDMDNDGNAAALAEARLGAGRGHGTVMMLTLGTGIGGGVVIDGRPLRGGGGTGAELGHVVVDMDGPPCQGTCPNHGCVETYASGTAISRLARERAAADPGGALAARAAAGALDARAVGELAAAGDAGALGVVERAGRALGVAVASLANVLSPGVVVVGGGVSAMGELLLGPARAEYRSRALAPNAAAPMVTAELGPSAGVLGAALLAGAGR